MCPTHYCFLELCNVLNKPCFTSNVNIVGKADFLYWETLMSFLSFWIARRCFSFIFSCAAASPENFLSSGAIRVQWNAIETVFACLLSNGLCFRSIAVSELSQCIFFRGTLPHQLRVLLLILHNSHVRYVCIVDRFSRHILLAVSSLATSALAPLYRE